MTIMPFELSALPADRAGKAARQVDHNRRLLASWLFLLAGMILVMVALGGVTRLTGSGLSIMRWAPLSGALPPLSHAAWERLYALYRSIPQYKLVNQGFGLSGFQHIFWLEWVHRLWGRLIGVAVLVPLAWFWWQGRLVPGLALRLLLLFILGGLQGVLGWLMVATGFRPDSTAVAAPFLVAHLCLALALYAAILWTGLSVLNPSPSPTAGARPLFRLTLLVTGLIALTIVAGGLVAGTHAGFIYNTFPLMDGRLIPSSYAALHPFLANLTRNVAAVQFDHRLLATVTVLTTLATAVLALRSPLPVGARRAFAALGLVVLLQYALGIATLLFVVPTALAVTHQITATLLLTAAIVALHSMRAPREAARSGVSA
ncbi:MAG TPA: COX15/CtaA family protein [Acetobacteraceae bacterium]|nr:COX15/CtaA family protein [Acetobacteraceae bacterium]